MINKPIIYQSMITDLSKIKYNIEVGMFKFPLNLLQVNYYFEIFPLQDIQLCNIGKNINGVAIYKYYDMVQNTRLITYARCELMSPKYIIVNNGKYTWSNYFQFKTFNVWKTSISKELIFEYNEISVN